MPNPPRSSPDPTVSPLARVPALTPMVVSTTAIFDYMTEHTKLGECCMTLVEDEGDGILRMSVRSMATGHVVTWEMTPSIANKFATEMRERVKTMPPEIRQKTVVDMTNRQYAEAERRAAMRQQADELVEQYADPSDEENEEPQKPGILERVSKAVDAIRGK